VGSNTVHCILSVPLIYGDEVIGVMNMTNKVKLTDPADPESPRVLDKHGLFTDTDEQLARGLADQAAVNLNKARIYNRSITDRLTGLKNTRFFEEQLSLATDKVVENDDEVLSLAITDLDHFKRCNDTHGHKAGDLVLAETARLLGELAARTPGVEAFRYGGEEFCMILQGHTSDAAAAVLETWRAEVEALELEFEGKILKVTGSVGICEFPRYCEHPARLFARADAALYESKGSGRNRITCQTSREEPVPIEAEAPPEEETAEADAAA
jgi:diguanylate cyclase (GGDEF)-like protein